MFIAGGLFEGGLFDEAPMGEVPVPDVSSIGEHPEPNAAAVASSVHDDSDDDMGDHFGGAPSPMGGMRYVILRLNKIRQLVPLLTFIFHFHFQ